MEDEAEKDKPNETDATTVTKEKYDEVVKKLADAEKERDEANNRIMTMSVTGNKDEDDTCEFDKIFLKGGQRT